VIVDRSELYKGKPVKALTVGKSYVALRAALVADEGDECRAVGIVLDPLDGPDLAGVAFASS
jgi:hypothetical protein